MKAHIFAPQGGGNRKINTPGQSFSEYRCESTRHFINGGLLEIMSTGGEGEGEEKRLIGKGRKRRRKDDERVKKGWGGKTR